MPTTIRPATRAQLQRTRLFTIYCDPGCSKTARSTAVRAVERPFELDAQPVCEKLLTLGDGIQTVIDLLSQRRSTCMLVLEAPLSSLTLRGSPARRPCDLKCGAATADWWINAGASTFLSAMHLLRSVRAADLTCEVLITEAIITHKNGLRANAYQAAFEKSAFRDSKKKDAYHRFDAWLAQQMHTNRRSDHTRYLPEDLRKSSIADSHWASILDWVEGVPPSPDRIPPVLAWEPETGAS